MNSQLNQLEEALVAEFQAVREYATLTERERESLRQDDLTALTHIVQQKEQQLTKMDGLERQRESVAAAWAAATMPGSELNSLESVLTHLDPASRKRLRTLRDGIMAHLDRANALNYGNRALLQSALARNAALREFLLEMTAGPSTYTSPGQPVAQGVQDSYLVDWRG